MSGLSIAERARQPHIQYKARYLGRKGAMCK